MHFQMICLMICLLGKLQNLNKVCFFKLFFFWDPATVGHLVNRSYNSIPEEFSQLAPFKCLIDLFLFYFYSIP